MNKEISLNNLYSFYKDFKKTPLYINGAQSIVLGEGDTNSPIVFIGEAPGADEDIEGRPFVGRSGKLLTQTIENYGILRKNVFITNIVKCRPPENRTPTLKELRTGKNLLLKEELLILQPKIIVPLGLCALNGLLEEKFSMNKVRGKKIESIYGTLFPTYHPAYILRNVNAYETFNNDIHTALKFAGLI